MTNSDTTLLRMLQCAGKDPQTHHNWISLWRQMFDELCGLPDAPGAFSEIEHAALGAVSNVNISGTHAHLRCEVRRMLNGFKHPAFLVDSDGRISAQNTMVGVTYDLNVGDKISDLPVELNLAESVEDVVKEVINTKLNNGKAVFKKALSRDSTRALTLAITKSKQGERAAALIFIISSKLGEKSLELIKNHYGLTTAESQVLVSFVEGFSLKEIASDRERSYATIRTQFNSLTTKMGADSQASLLRTVFSLSDFNTEIEKLSTVLAHPFRRTANIMRDGGRMVEVCFCGDSAGSPLLHVPSAAANKFNANVEKMLFSAGIYLITVCPPAHGMTDPAPEGKNRSHCQAEDIEAVLDMLSIDSCPIMVTSAGTYAAFDLAASLPKRISQILLVAACPPGVYWSRHGTSAPWTDAVLRIDEKYAAVRKIIAAANLKSLVTVGSKQYHKLQLAGNNKDVETVMQPENAVELEYALESATTFGMSSIMEDIRALFTDYSEKISSSSCDVSIIHGEMDPWSPIQAMRNLQADYPDRVKLYEFEDAGFTVLQSHTKEVVSLISNIVSDVGTGLAAIDNQ